MRKATRDAIATVLDFMEFILQGEFREGGALDQFEEDCGWDSVELGRRVAHLGKQVHVKAGWDADSITWRGEREFPELARRGE